MIALVCLAATSKLRSHFPFCCWDFRPTVYSQDDDYDDHKRSIAKNKPLHELHAKGSQYRGLQPSNWKQAFESVKEAVENYIDKVSKKEKLAKILFRECKTEFLHLVADRIKQLRKQRVNYRAYSLHKSKLKQQYIIDQLKA
ncbi:unnamed protein product [Didymodactylos carnosus]|uniref:Uncharacterized protein n=1 Tax=Didymodactylos carnosus TaxID=1234261 RepID=A0A816C6H6_9BILA|nr:unnamed protein product [Didymodactylos carnosus]CAF4507425.1 unnamed protein product [Didymodactylos carnosus]